MVRAKRSDEISSSEITSEEWPRLWKAIEKLSFRESCEVREIMPERILPSRFRLRNKPADAVAKGQPEVTVPSEPGDDEISKVWNIAKDRWIMVGFDDPDFLELETTSRAAQQTVNLFTSVSAGFVARDVSR